MQIIQNHTLPQLNSLPPDSMYLRGEYLINRTESQINLLKGEKCDFGTYFNSLAVKVWKQDCDIRNIILLIKGSGKLKIEFIHRNTANREVVADEILLTLDRTNEQTIPLQFWKNLNEGLVYIRMFALTDATIDKIAYATPQLPNTEVKLGIVITHFNRQPYVCRAAKRIEQELLSDKNYSNIRLIIVDNSKNLNLEEKSENIQVIKNNNVGGSGGFTRGLLELKDNNFTHCCFMDDDASCDIEALRRTYAFFSYAKTDIKWGLSGTLLLDQQPELIHEAGATFYRSRVIPIGHHLNATNLNDVNWITHNGGQGNYGAWCYFAFAISDITHYSYPFFVRGDDMFFSIQNNLKITSINGVCTWIDDFLLKESPMTRYLGLRSLLTITILQNKMSLSRFIKIFYQWHRALLNSYLYASCSAIEESVLDILKGPRIYSDDIDGSVFLAKIKPFQKTETLNIPPSDVKFDHPHIKESSIHRFLRKISLNGLLIPSFLFKKTVLQPKAFSASTNQIFAYRNIYYFDPVKNKGMICSHNKIKIIEHLIKRGLIILKIIFNYRNISKKYNNDLIEMTSEHFWRNRFQ